MQREKKGSEESKEAEATEKNRKGELCSVKGDVGIVNFALPPPYVVFRRAVPLS